MGFVSDKPSLSTFPAAALPGLQPVQDGYRFLKTHLPRMVCSVAKCIVNLHNSSCLLLLKLLNREYPENLSVSSHPSAVAVGIPMLMDFSCAVALEESLILTSRQTAKLYEPLH